MTARSCWNCNIWKWIDNDMSSEIILNNQSIMPAPIRFKDATKSWLLRDTLGTELTVGPCGMNCCCCMMAPVPCCMPCMPAMLACCMPRMSGCCCGCCMTPPATAMTPPPGRTPKAFFMAGEVGGGGRGVTGLSGKLWIKKVIRYINLPCKHENIGKMEQSNRILDGTVETDMQETDTKDAVQCTITLYRCRHNDHSSMQAFHTRKGYNWKRRFVQT